MIHLLGIKSLVAGHVIAYKLKYNWTYNAIIGGDTAKRNAVCLIPYADDYFEGGIMKKKIIIFGLMIASTVLILPLDGFAGAANKPASVGAGTDTQISVSIGQPRRRRRVWRNGRWVWIGYRNYGQYRRNRRYRIVRRTYWDDGYRRTRLVRVYY